MTRISTFCVLSSTLAVTALSANGASAVNITVHTAVPKVIVYVPQPKVNVHTPQLKILSNHGTVVGTKSGSNHGLLKDNLKGNSNEVGISAPTTIELSPNSPTVGGAYQATVVGPRIPTGGGAYQTTVAWPSSPTGGGAYQTTVVGPRIPTGGAYQTTVVGPRIPTVGVVPIIGDQEGNPDRPIIIGSVYKTTPSFSFNKIDPAAKASIVSVIQPGGAGDGTKVSILLATKPGGGIDGQNPVTSLPAVGIPVTAFGGSPNIPTIGGARTENFGGSNTGSVGGNVPFNVGGVSVGAGTIGSNVSPSTSAGSGPENPLYRVQIHQGSAGGFNWSRD